MPVEEPRTFSKEDSSTFLSAMFWLEALRTVSDFGGRFKNPGVPEGVGGILELLLGIFIHMTGERADTGVADTPVKNGKVNAKTVIAGNVRGDEKKNALVTEERKEEIEEKKEEKGKEKEEQKREGMVLVNRQNRIVLLASLSRISLECSEHHKYHACTEAEKRGEISCGIRRSEEEGEERSLQREAPTFLLPLTHSLIIKQLIPIPDHDSTLTNKTTTTTTTSSSSSSNSRNTRPGRCSPPSPLLSCDRNNFRLPTHRVINEWVEDNDSTALWISIISVPSYSLSHSSIAFSSSSFTSARRDTPKKENLDPEATQDDDEMNNERDSNLKNTKRRKADLPDPDSSEECSFGSEQFFPMISETFFSVGVGVQVRSLVAVCVRLKEYVLLKLSCSEGAADTDISVRCGAVWGAARCCSRVVRIAQRVVQAVLSDTEDISLTIFEALFSCAADISGR